MKAPTDNPWQEWLIMSAPRDDARLDVAEPTEGNASVTDPKGSNLQCGKHERDRHQRKKRGRGEAHGRGGQERGADSRQGGKRQHR